MLRIYEKDLTAETVSEALMTNGLGILKDAVSCTVHRIINGDWSLRMTYPLDAPGASLLTPERLICYEDDAGGDAQLYRIARRSPRSTRQGRVIEIEAPHVAYDLCHKYITNIETKEDSRYPNGINAREALTQLLAGTGFQVGEVTVDMTALDYLDILQKDVMSCVKEQLLDQWGGELQFDNFTLHLKAALGEDRRYPIRDGRNIEQITVTEDYEPVVTRLHVRGYDNANFEDINDGKDYIDSTLMDRYSHIREGYADFADIDDPEELMRLGLEELTRREVPEITYDIRLAQMRGSVQYAAYRRLESFGLSDTAALHTSVLDHDIILRCSEMETDCLTGRNTSVKLGNADKELMAAITAGASASDRLAGVLTPDGYLQAEKIAGKLNLVRVENLAAEIARIATAQISQAEITAAQIKGLEADIANILRLQVNWAEIDSLQARIVEAVTAEIGDAAIDFAQIKDLIADKQVITQGEAGELYIADLAVTEGNMVRLSLGQLLLKGADGGFYEIRVDNGQVVAQRADVAGAIEDGTVDGGKLIEGSVTADRLNVQDIFADNALVRQLMAANIDVGELFAREAFISKLNAVDIMANESLRVFVDSQSDLSDQIRAWFNFSHEGELGIGRSDQAYNTVVSFDGFAIRYYTTKTLYFKEDTGFIPKLVVDETLTLGDLNAAPSGDYIVWS